MRKWALCLLFCLLVGSACSVDEVPLPEPVEMPVPMARELSMEPIAEYDEKTPPEVPPGRIAYITIDDGPSEAVTPRILDILRIEGVRATFFVLPHEGVDHIYERILNEGHAVGNHSYSHDYKRLYDKGDDGVFFREDVLRAGHWLEERFGHETDLFRFPGGSESWDKDVIARRREILEELGYRVFDWDVSNGDTDRSPAGRDPEMLTANVMARATDERDRLIVLMHDTGNKAATAEALPRVIMRLKAAGYGFDTLEGYR